MESAYVEDQYKLSYPDEVEHHWWHLTRNAVIAHELKKVLKNDSRLLEIGCGRGIVVKYLRERKINCVGIEPASVTPLREVNEFVRSESEPADLSVAERERYDVIALFDVIEHIPDPVAFLRPLGKLFPNLKHVVITVPGRAELWSDWDDFYGHHRRYSMKMIEDLSGNLSWKVVRRGYFFHTLYIAIWATIILRVKRSIKIDAPAKSIRSIHRIFSLGQIWEYHLLPKSIPGTSIITCFSVPTTGRDAEPGPC